MRELKFRAWNGEGMISPDYIDRKGIAHWKENSIPSFSYEVMQYTGLKDKNGKDIYEGDILQGYNLGERIGNLDTVIFENAKFKLKNTPKELIHFTHPLSDFECQVVGNIYENTELLNQ